MWTSKRCFLTWGRGHCIARIAIKNDIVMSKLTWEKPPCLLLFEKACIPAVILSSLPHYTGPCRPWYNYRKVQVNIAQTSMYLLGRKASEVFLLLNRFLMVLRYYVFLVYKHVEWKWKHAVYLPPLLKDNYTRVCHGAIGLWTALSADVNRKTQSVSECLALWLHVWSL